MKHRKFVFSFPWITLYIMLLIPLLTYVYANLPTPLKNSPVLWLTSPFNIFYELQNTNGFFYNYILVVLIFLFVELYSRNLADLRGRISLIRNAALLSALSSYVISAIVWVVTGFPSSGTSIVAFDILIFAGFETYDSEMIKRMSEKKGIAAILEISSLVFIALVLILFMLLFVYINKNSFWYVHVAGGLLFAPLYYVYLSHWVRPGMDRLEEKIEEKVEEDLEEEIEKVEGKKKRKSRRS